MASAVASARPAPRRSALDPAAPLLAVVAEAAWVSVLVALAQALVHERAILGVGPLAALVATGLLVARTVGVRLGERWPPVAVALTLGAAFAGWLVSPTVREAVVAGDLSRALGDHLGGWLAGLALLRGFAHAMPLRSEAALGRVVGLGTPGLAALVLLGGAVAEPWRGWFLTDAVVGVVLLLGAGTLGLAIARISAVGSSGGFDWRRNRPWLALLLGLVVAIAVIAPPASVVLGPAVQVAVGVLVVPLLLVGLVAGFGYTSWRALAALLIIGTFVILAAALGPDLLTPIELPEGVGAGGSVTRNQGVVAAAAGGALVLIVVVILVLARLWMRGIRAPAESDVPEERTIDRGVRERPAVAGRARGGQRRRGDPTDAAGAYRALVEDIADRGEAARQSTETPAEHALRLRRRGLGGLSLDLLAADYQLDRFGGSRLSPTEHRRAIGRWRRLRELIGQRMTG